jgi:anti-sigma regulatory factor (Ser/Thr protein kinase)
MADRRSIGSGVEVVGQVSEGPPVDGATPMGRDAVTLSGKGFREAEICITAELQRLPEIRSFADTCANAYGFDEEVRYQIKMAASEAVANAVEHGSHGPSDQVRVRAVDEGGLLAFYVSDNGSFVSRIAPRGALPERGRGLAFLGQLMDEVDIRPGPTGTTLRFAKRL